MCGNPTLSSPYRSELSGLAAILYLIQCICLHQSITSGNITLYCDNSGALCNVFRRRYKGITQFLHTDSDLVQLAISLLVEIPIKVQAKWVKGQSTATKKTLPETLNTIADKLAGSYVKLPDRNFRPIALPLAHPNYKIRLLYKDSTITTKLYHTLHTAQHSDSLRNHIIGKANWSPQVFNMADWDAHERSYKCLTRHQKITTSKLLHQLVNTNRQNRLYYGESDKCPCCNQMEETFQHVLQCSKQSATRHRQIAFSQLIDSLKASGTPGPLLDALTHGMNKWNLSTDPIHLRALTAGSLHAGDTLLKTAFKEQFSTIGWYQMLLGRISVKWGKAYAAYVGSSCTTQQQISWSSLLITLL
jgi:hypothetical protein